MIPKFALGKNYCSLCLYLFLPCVHTSDLNITKGAGLFKLEDSVAVLVFKVCIGSFHSKWDLIPMNQVISIWL